MRARMVVPLLIGALVAAGCGAVYAPSGSTSGASTPGGAVGSSVAPPGSSSSASSTIPSPQQVTMADSGKTIAMRVGETFLLALGDQQQWDVKVDDQTVVARVPNIMVVRGAQGVYRALKPGTTTLEATGTAICAQGQPCPMYAIAFHVTLQVSA